LKIGQKVIIDGLVKSPSIPQSGRVRVEPFEFTSNGGGGVALPRRVKRRKPTFYEVIIIDSFKKLKYENCFIIA
jgi:hypothetical protein